MKKVYLVVILALAFLASFKAVAQDKVPGVVVYHSHPSTGIYLGSPSIVVLDDGTYVASMDEFGKVIEQSGKPNHARIFASHDKGVTWKQIAVVENAFWSNLFLFKGGPLFVRNNKTIWENGYTQESGWRKNMDNSCG